MNATFPCVKPPEEKLNQCYLLQLEGTEGHARSVDCTKIYRVWICIVHFTQTKFKGRKSKAQVSTMLWWCVLIFRSYFTASLFRYLKTGPFNVPTIVAIYTLPPSVVQYCSHLTLLKTITLTPGPCKDSLEL